MPSRALAPTLKTYAQLRDAVVTIVVKGREEIDRAWLETYHATGRLINEHILEFCDRADYGAHIYEKLAEDTSISVRTLRQCAQFHRCYPIRHARAKLGWAHYQLLIQVEDTARRKTIEAEAIRKHWTSRELETRVRSYNATALAAHDDAPAAPVALLTPRRGTPGLHPIIDLGNELAVDLGFRFYRELTSASKLQPGDIVRLSDAGIRKVDAATKAQLFTYTATVRTITDGDTLLVALILAPGFTHRLKLRLRGLDCPEVATAAGRAAKAFVENLLRPGDEVIISTTKPDKYDRYLADVFIVPSKDVAGLVEPGPGSTPPATAPIFLNNALLSARYDGGAKEE